MPGGSSAGSGLAWPRGTRGTLAATPAECPAAIGFGVDPVHFGVMMILNLILGTIHPPIGVVLFITSRIAGISFEKMSRAIMPWLIPLLIVLAPVTFWPPLTLWLPNLLFAERLLSFLPRVAKRSGGKGTGRRPVERASGLGCRIDALAQNAWLPSRGSPPPASGEENQAAPHCHRRLHPRARDGKRGLGSPPMLPSSSG